MENMPKKLLDFLRDQFPLGSRIMLTEMKADPQPLPPGSTGTLNHIDEAGQFHILWDSGISMALMPGADRFQVLPQELQTLKLYMPLTADFYETDEYGGLSDYASELGGEDLVQYAGCILNSLINERLPEEAERGIMHWYGESDTVDAKVHSVVFTAEIRDNRLWGVAECKIAGKLFHQELEDLKEYIAGQAADGWGEGFEQRPIRLDDGELYVHLWNSENWSIQTEKERFAPKTADGLPALCFSILRTTGQLICIKRGDTGYYPSDWDTGNREENEKLADDINSNMGVSPIQRQAMEIGSMCGWDVPGADPANYKVHDSAPMEGPQLNEMEL